MHKFHPRDRHIDNLRQRSVVQRIPFPLAATTAAIFLFLGVRVMVMFALNVTFRTAVGDTRRFRNDSLALVVFFSVKQASKQPERDRGKEVSKGVRHPEWK